MKKMLAFAAVLLLGGAGNLCAAIHGSWTASTETAKAGRIHVNISRGNWQHYGNTMKLADFRGLSDAQIHSGVQTPVQFQLAREAGTLQFEGVFKNGDGAGQFTFQSNPSFANAVRGLGVAFELKHRRQDQNEENDLFNLAMTDVSTAFIRSMQAEGYNVSLDKYLQMRLHGATPEFAEEMKRLGYGGLRHQDLVSFRIHGVTAEFIRELRELGYTDIPAKKLIQMRIHGIDASFVRKMNSID